MAITQAQIAERLLKKSQGVAETKYPLADRGISEEAISTYSLVSPLDIWAEADKIPSTPPVMTNGEEIGVIKYYVKLPLSITDLGTTVAFKAPELADSIPSKFGFNYKYRVYGSDGVTQIDKGDWMVDSESGTIIFYSPGLTEAPVNAANPPRISFYKYIGKKGFDVNNTSLDLTGLTINGNLLVSGGTITGNGSGLTNIPASGITGLQLDRISSGGNSAIIGDSGLVVNTNITGDTFVKLGGTTNQFLKADGSIDDRDFLTTSGATNNYLNLTGGTISGNLNVSGDIIQNGESWSTHVNEVYSSGDTIFLRDGAISALPASGFTGIVAKKYDGDNDGVLVFDSNGVARIGDMDILTWTGATQAIATREDLPIHNGVARWDSTKLMFVTKTLSLSDITDISGVTIGAAEDGSYSDGIFTDFTSETPIGTAIDRFNEMFLKLAPTPPSDWSTAGFTIASQGYSARALSGGGDVSITTITSPTFNVGVPSNGLNEIVNGATLAFRVDGTTQETANVFGTPTKNSGVVRYTYADPYVGQAGKAGFWTGFTSVSAVSTALTPSSNLRTATYVHSTKGNLNRTFYLDSPLTVSIGTITATVPTMTGNVSGVKTLQLGQSITNIAFNITNVSSYFYAATSVWAINAGIVAGVAGNPNSVPTSYGETGSVTNASTTILTNKFSDTNISFTVKGRNSIGTYGADTTFTSPSTRVDTVSIESERLTSGVGLYPSVFGSTYDSSISLTAGYTNELQLINGSYKWLSGNYTAFDSPNYAGVTTGDNIGGTHYRWATFDVGTKSSAVNNVTITIPSAVIGSSWNAIKMYVKIGDSGWVDGTIDPVAIPYNNGDGALNKASSPSYNVRVITFGTVPRSGKVYVRLGIKSTDTTFTFKKPTMA